MHTVNDEQLTRMHAGAGFIAALDQSGGSTPKALAGYGIEQGAWSTEEEMFDLVHEMRTRVITNPAFDSEHILAAILFEMTMDRDIEGTPTATYLWEHKHIVPFLKIDKGLAELDQGVRLMKPIPDLDALLEKAVAKGIFGTKERSVVLEGKPSGIRSVVRQQFDLAHQVLDHGLVPIIEPEVDIHTVDRALAETVLLTEINACLDELDDGQKVMLKLTIPERDDFYADLIADPRVLRVVALSGGFSQAEACEKLARNHGLIASFSRALLQGLTAQQSDEEFTATLRASIEKIAAASAS
ncbi:MAG: fructose bisphosphate aldolase [Actinomyces sp.]|nr:fructose bisphosphate aldolase [Actinomyces sp.]MDN6794273.1 fructose bisphosphate aldolase [Propionibacterium sp.]